MIPEAGPWPEGTETSLEEAELVGGAAQAKGSRGGAQVRSGWGLVHLEQGGDRGSR
jgi:hypothetical protein